MSTLVSDSMTVVRRNLIKIKRVPDLLVFTTLQPIMFVLLFGYVFGATLASTGVGWVVHEFGWGATYGLLTLSVVLTIALLLCVLPREKQLMAHHRSLSGTDAQETRS